MRLFVAIDLPGPMREKLAALITRLKRELTGPKWVRPEGVHLTLRFLGEVGEPDLPRLRTALGTIADGSGRHVDVSVEGLGQFPERGRPRVLWIGLHEPGGMLAALQRRVEQAVRSAALPGIKDEEKEFRPHLTLARLGEANLSAAIRILIERQPLESLGSFQVSAVTLFQSLLGPGGAQYRVIEVYPL